MGRHDKYKYHTMIIRIVLLLGIIALFTIAVNTIFFIYLTGGGSCRHLRGLGDPQKIDHFLKDSPERQKNKEQ